jgi:hypothetical protein
MKKFVLLAMMALSFLAMTASAEGLGAPLPGCPCDWVR